MRIKHVLPASERTMIAIDWEVHILIKRYARERGITIAEAAYRLIGIGLTHEWRSEWKNDNSRLCGYPEVSFTGRHHGTENKTQRRETL